MKDHDKPRAGKRRKRAGRKPPATGRAPTAPSWADSVESARDAESRFRAIFEAEPECVKLLDADGRLLDMNPAGLAMIEAESLEQVRDRPVAPIVAPAYRDAFADLCRRVFAGGEGTLEFEIVALKGARRWLETHAVPLRGPDGWVTSLLGITRDVTRRKRAEVIQNASYRISEAVHSTRNLRELYQAIHDIVGELMPARNFYLALYEAATDLISFPYFVDEHDDAFPPKKPGKGLTEYVIRTGRPLLASPDVFRDLERIGEVELIGAPSVDWLGVPLKAGGRTFGALVVQTYSEGVRYGDAEIGLLQFVSTQVAMAIERKRAEDALRDSEASYRALVEHAVHGIYRATPDGRFLTVNPALVSMLGYASERELLALDVARDVYTDSAELARILALARERDETTAETAWKRKDGRIVTVRLTGRSVRGPDGEVACYEVFAEDVTEQRTLEQRLRQSQRIEAVGRLAGGIAHDFNNLLTAILGSTDALLDALVSGHPQREDVEEIRTAAVRAADLTQRLLAFSRRQVLQPRGLDLNALVANMDKLLRRLIGEHIVLRTVLAPNLGAVRADPGQFEQVIANLVVNARDAMPAGGELTIETANAVLGETNLHELPAAAPGPYVVLAVSDTGTGMDPDTQTHLFEPFFTTKERGKGTGLGLSTVYGIVKQSGGYILTQSELGRGTTFRMYLPRVAQVLAPEPRRPTAEAPARGTETILAAEDEAGVLKLLRRTLQAKGYTVLTAASGDEALDVAARWDGPIHLLVTDVVMPGMTGPDAARRLALS
ncbi:MAG: PAS domain S-box protein, partial [Gemmatimonadetes bacterium]|nr:PAS domain S-box protein [Gemmatimonadota bacterium]